MAPPNSLGWTRNFASGYDAVDRVGQRRAVSPILRSEDQHLRPIDARKIIAYSRDLSRNFSLVGWVIRQHLNYLAEFDFQCHDDQIGVFVAERDQPAVGQPFRRPGMQPGQRRRVGRSEPFQDGCFCHVVPQS